MLPMVFTPSRRPSTVFSIRSSRRFMSDSKSASSPAPESVMVRGAAVTSSPAMTSLSTSMSGILCTILRRALHKSRGVCLEGFDVCNQSFDVMGDSRNFFEPRLCHLCQCLFLRERHVPHMMRGNEMFDNINQFAKCAHNNSFDYGVIYITPIGPTPDVEWRPSRESG